MMFIILVWPTLEIFTLLHRARFVPPKSSAQLPDFIHSIHSFTYTKTLS